MGYTSEKDLTPLLGTLARFLSELRGLGEQNTHAWLLRPRRRRRLRGGIWP